MKANGRQSAIVFDVLKCITTVDMCACFFVVVTLVSLTRENQSHRDI